MAVPADRPSQTPASHRPYCYGAIRPIEPLQESLSFVEHGPSGLRARQRRLPPAVGERAVTILVGRARRLRHSVQRHHLGHDELAHAVVWMLRGVAV